MQQPQELADPEEEPPLIEEERDSATPPGSRHHHDGLIWNAAVERPMPWQSIGTQDLQERRQSALWPPWNVGIIGGSCGLPHRLPPRPPEPEKTRKEPYLAADLAGEICCPTPIYWHHAKPRPIAGNPLLQPRLKPEPPLHLLQTTSSPARASVRSGRWRSTLNGSGGRESLPERGRKP
jgi:hypothetical protein